MRRYRLLSAWVALLGILFSQMVLSAYACPQLLPANVPAQMESHGDMVGMPCAGMDSEQPVLCEQYGQQGHQSVGSNSPFDFHPVLGLLFVAAASNPDAGLPMFDLRSSLLARAASPPPLLRSQRLRI
jgi:hypothetical protein